MSNLPIHRVRRKSFDRLNLSMLWREHLERTHGNRWHDYIRESFLKRLVPLTTQPDRLDEISWCADCSYPAVDDSMGLDEIVEVVASLASTGDAVRSWIPSLVGNAPRPGADDAAVVVLTPKPHS